MRRWRVLKMSKDLQYPIGPFEAQTNYTEGDREMLIEDIALLPEQLSSAIQDLSEAQLDTPYRAGGWTVRQVCHHLADSHINGYIRLKMALTEEDPTIKPYLEAKWAALPDSNLDPAISLRILEGVHQRWYLLLINLQTKDWSRTYIHPEKGRPVRLDESLHNYAWHGKHHVAHITELRNRMGW